MLSIGEFSARTGLSVKALRLYDERGLLAPAAVEDQSGYRRYAEAQVERGRLIGLLRGCDVGLAEIGLLLADLDQEPAAALSPRQAAAARLERHMRQMEVAQSARRLLSRHIFELLREEELSMFPISVRTVPSRRVLSIQRRLFADQTDAFVAEAKAAFAEHLAGTTPTSPFTVVFHGVVDHENDGPIEAILGCPDDVQPTATIGIRTEPAHEEAFTPITKAQWQFPAILAAYDAVACSSGAKARGASSLSCREVYLAEPDDVGDEALLCEVAFPLGDAGPA